MDHPAPPSPTATALGTLATSSTDVSSASHPIPIATALGVNVSFFINMSFASQSEAFEALKKYCEKFYFTIKKKRDNSSKTKSRSAARFDYVFPKAGKYVKYDPQFTLTGRKKQTSTRLCECP